LLNCQKTKQRRKPKVSQLTLKKFKIRMLCIVLKFKQMTGVQSCR
jgi:hypothetical protein